MSNDWSPVDLNTEIRLGKVPDLNYPKVNDIFQMMVTPPVPTDNVQKGQVVVRNLYLSIDAAMRVWISGKKTYMDPVVPGDVMRAMGVGVIIFSNGNLKAGDIVMGMLEWQKFCLIKEKELIVLPKDYPNPQHFLGVYGISGLTAYFGLFEVGKIKAGDIVVVSAAAGAVGELAIQLAKNAGCTVIGVAGGQDKCDYVKSIGADAVIDYKQVKFLDSLRKACPKGVDVYFDNVGGQMLDDVLMAVRDNCRIILCGAISTYNDDPKNPYRLKNYQRLIIKRGTMQGYIYFDYKKKFNTAIVEMMKQVNEGKLKFREDISNGVEEAPAALQKLLLGKNNGKVLVKLIWPEIGPDQFKPKL
jgi:NADPH-dependent curcumin reductase CurA